MKARALRLQQAAGALIEDLGVLEQVTSNEVVWVEGVDDSPMLRVAPLDVAAPLKDTLWDQRTTELTRATLPARLPARTPEERPVGTECVSRHRSRGAP